MLPLAFVSIRFARFTRTLENFGNSARQPQNSRGPYRKTDTNAFFRLIYVAGSLTEYCSFALLLALPRAPVVRVLYTFRKSRFRERVAKKQPSEQERVCCCPDIPFPRQCTMLTGIKYHRQNRIYLLPAKGTIELNHIDILINYLLPSVTITIALEYFTILNFVFDYVPSRPDYQLKFIVENKLSKINSTRTSLHRKRGTRIIYGDTSTFYWLASKNYGLHRKISRNNVYFTKIHAIISQTSIIFLVSLWIIQIPFFPCKIMA